MKVCSWVRFVAVGVFFGLLSAGAAGATDPADPPDSGVERESPPFRAEVEALRNSAAGLRVRIDPGSGFATFIGGGPDGLAGSREAIGSRNDTALRLLARFGPALGLDSPDRQLRTGAVSRTERGTAIALAQVHHGLEVLDHGVRVYFDEALRPIAIDSNVLPGLTLEPSPGLSPGAALAMALPGEASPNKVEDDLPLFVYRDSAGIDHLVYRFAVGETGEIYVDAHTGATVGKGAKAIGDARFETHIVSSVGAAWVGVSLTHTYDDPVVVCTAEYSANTVPVVTRVRLHAGPPHGGFDVRLQNPGDLAGVAAETVHCLVMETGNHVIDGHRVEAQAYDSTVTDRKNSWPGQAQAYLQSYTDPVVVGQVMSDNDPAWSVFWSKGSSRTVPPSPTALTTGKTVAEDTSTARAAERVGFIVFEAAHGMIGGVEFEARVGSRTVSGIDNGPPHVYTYDTPFPAAPDVAVHSMAGVVGGDGGWSQSFATSPSTTATTLQLSIDEDQIGDAERSHGTERVAYLVFADEVAFPFVAPTGCPGNTDAECDDGLFCNGAETCNVEDQTCLQGPPPCTGLQVCDEGLDACVTGPTLRMESGIVPIAVGAAKVRVNLAHTYASPVVVTNVLYNNNGTPVVTRVSNVTATGFDVRLQSPSGAAVQPETVFFLVVEEGNWMMNGVAFEAKKYLSTVTDAKNSWTGSVRTYGHSYVSPVVIGQVMSENDPDFSVYWQSGSTRPAAPDNVTLKNGKTVLEDPDRTRNDETIGYVVFEAVHTTLLGVEMEAATGLDTIRGAVNGAPFSYILNQPFPAPPSVVLTSAAGIDGGDGAWSQSHGMTVGSASTLNLSVDEDDVGDTERSHTHEQVSYVAFAMPLVFPEPPEPTCTEDAECPGFADFCDGPDTCFNGACIDGNPPCLPGQECTELGLGTGVCVTPAAKLETIGLAGVGGAAKTASPTFQNGPYQSPVVVCAAEYANNTVPFVVRVGNVTPDGFDVWLQNPGDGSAVVPEDVNCLVVEEGVWEIDGQMIEAQKYTSTLTDRERNWLGVAQSLNHDFVNPVVLGQVMSANDARWSTYWQQGSSRTQAPSNGFLRNGKAVMEDPDTARLDETVGFIVFEAGRGAIGGVDFEARTGEDIVAGVTNGPPYTVNFTAPFATTPEFAVVTQAGMDGSDGSWAYLFGSSPLTTTGIRLAVDEDQLFNAERGHTTEQVSYVVFAGPASFSAREPAGSLIAGQNINIVAGSDWPGGDPFLQRQNEPSGAVSSRSVMNLLVGANDYRTVDIPGLPGGKETGDAWLGIFKSYDGGNIWRSDLVPGYPQDTSLVGRESPLFGYDAGADPVIRAGAHGLFLYSGIVFDRGPDAKSATFVARYLDLNNDPAGDSIRYVDTVLVDSDPGGTETTGFIDKTWLAMDVPRSGLDPVAFPHETVSLDVAQSGGGQQVAQQITCGNAYLSLSRILGGGTSSEVFLSRSTDCGGTWSEAVRVSSVCAISQGSTIAIDPSNGDVHVAWRQFPGSPAKGTTCPGDPPVSAILHARSTDGGQTFSAPAVVTEIDPFDQPANVAGFLSFRSNAFPTMAVDETGRAYVAWTGRGRAADADPIAGDSRILISTSRNGQTWTASRVVDEPGVRGHQIQPSLTYAHGRLALAFLDFREDLSGVFSSLVFDLDGPPGQTPLPVHTGDVRAAIAEPGDNPVFTINNVTPGQGSTKASKYQFIFGGEDENDAELVQFDANTMNYPLFVGGGTPFMGDYIEIFTQTMSADPDGSWTFKNNGPPPADQWHVVWADNRDVIPPPDNDWTNYKPPLSAQNPAGGGASLFDPNETVPVCDPQDAQDVQRTGMRNQNIYTARLTQGLFAGAPGNSKPLGLLPGSADLFQRSFVVWVQNTSDQPKVFRLTIQNQPPGGEASFDQFALLTAFEIQAGPDSGVARTVYVTSTDAQAAINVLVEEIDGAGGDPVEGGLVNTVVLNPDPIAPPPTDPSLTQEEIFNLAILNLAILNPAILNQDVENLAILNLAILNPAILNLAILNPADPNLAILNPAILNLAILNLAILNPAILNPAILNSADPNLAILNLAILNPAILNPAILNPAILNGALTDVTYTVENQGNSTAAYDFRAALNSGNDPPAKTAKGMPEPPMAFSLMVYKVHTVPAAGEACELGEETTHELLVNVVNPDLSPLTIEEADASFFLAPGENALITLRVLDYDETVGEPFDPEELEVAVQSQSVNTVDLPDGQPPFALPPPSGRIVPAVAAAGAGQTITIFGDPEFTGDITDFEVEFFQSPGVPGTIVEDASFGSDPGSLYVRLPDSLSPGLAEVKVGNSAVLPEVQFGGFVTVAAAPTAPIAIQLLKAGSEGPLFPCSFAFVASAPTELAPGDWVLVPAHGIDLSDARVQFEVPGSGLPPVVVPATCGLADPAWGIAAVARVPALPPGIIEIRVGTEVDGVQSPLSNALSVANVCGDGNLDGGETCDPPGSNGGQPNECRDSCTACGDGLLNGGIVACDDGKGGGLPCTFVEECDDGNNNDNDGCSSTCRDEVCGDGIVHNEPDASALFFQVDPQRTYLRTDAESGALNAIPIDLDDAGFLPGDLIRIERIGEYVDDFDGGPDLNRFMTAVFSGSSTLGSSLTLNRVADAINAGHNIFTPPTAGGGHATAILEDFFVFGAGDGLPHTDIVVPAGATHLFVSPFDDDMGNNADLSGSYGVELVLLTGEACDDGNDVDGDGCESDCTQTPGLVLLNDDDHEPVDIGFSFPFCGSSYTEVFIGSNGHLTFGGGTSAVLDGIDDFLEDFPTIAGLAIDLDPSDGGSVVVTSTEVEMEIRFINVPETEFGGAKAGAAGPEKGIGSNTFTFLLRDDGSYTVSYGSISATRGLAGRTPGGIDNDPGESDLNGLIQTPIPYRTTYESFIDADNDLDGETTEWAACPAIEIARPGVLYGGTDQAAGSQFFTVDPATGAGLILGATDLSNGVNAMAINSAGEIFAGEETDLYRIDAGTGEATYLSTYSTFERMTGLAFDENDVLYGRDLLNQLVIIDPDSGAVTVVGSDATSLDALTFDPGGVLYASEPFGNDIFTVDRTTGVATDVGANGQAGGTPGLTFVDDVMYGLNPLEVGTQLIRLFGSEGGITGTSVGDLGIEGGNALAARPNACGNAVTETGEQCDDGNTVAGDGCEPTCILTSLPLGDDDAVAVDVPYFEFPFCGVLYDTLHVGSNGYVTFGAPDTSPFGSGADLVSGPPRIAALWMDLKPDVGGAVQAGPVGDEFVVRYTDVPGSDGGLNTFSLTLRRDGSFSVAYDQADSFDSYLVGKSVGGGTADPGDLDLSSLAQPVGGGLTTLYEEFDGPTSDGLDLFGGLDFVGCFHPAAAGACYATTGHADGGRLFVLDAFAPAATLIGDTGVAGMPGLAINSRGEMFGTDRDIGHLYRLDAITGLATLVHAFGNEVPFMNGIAFDENDVLYGVTFDDQPGAVWNLRTVDVINGTSTIIGNATDYMVGLAFDPADNQLYGSTPSDRIFSIDTVTGAGTLIGTTGVSVGPGGTGGPNATPDLCFLGSTLFGSKGGGQVADNAIITIDPGTAEGSIVGSVPFRSISGMASRNSCGNGTLDPGETCETPGVPDGALDECRPGVCSFCGDGVVNHDEVCDDGNNLDGDGCPRDCSSIAWIASPPPHTPDCAGPTDGLGRPFSDVDFDAAGEGWGPVDLPDQFDGGPGDRFYRGTFQAETAGQGFFLTHHSNDGIRVYINGSLVASYLDCHEATCVNGIPEWGCGNSIATPQLDLSPWVVAGPNVIAVHVTDGLVYGQFDAVLSDEATGNLALDDDDFTEVVLPFGFPVCGTTYDAMFVNSNGSITFGEDDEDFFDDHLPDFLEGPPRIAGLWADLDPSDGGFVRVSGSATEVAVEFVDVPTFGDDDSNSFTIRLFPDGTSRVDYGTLETLIGVAGRTTGEGAVDPGELDLSAATPPIGTGENTVYELFESVDEDVDLSDVSLEYDVCELARALPGVCYGSTGRHDTPSGRLLSIDLATGAGTVLGETGLDRVPALAINAAGEMFGTDGPGDNLYRLDAETGDRVRVGSLGESVEGMAFDDTGTLYGVAGNETLVIIDPATAEITEVGGSAPFGLTVGMAFDPESDTLFGSSNSSDPRAIYTIDRGTGAFTTLGQTSPDATFGQTTPDLCAVDGSLYGTWGDGTPALIRRLIAVDKATGAGTDIGSIGFAAVSGLASRVPSCGDGRMDAILGEECDDGNTNPADLCDACSLVPLPLGDDDFIEVALPFEFPFCGVVYDSVFVGSNGFVTFGAGDDDPTPTVAELHAGPPRIAGLWADLNPTLGGAVTVNSGPAGFEVAYTAVPENTTKGGFFNTFTITLFPDGTSRLAYDNVPTAPSLVGRSKGGGVADPGETDLSGVTQPIGAGQVAVYERFAGGDVVPDLSGVDLDFAACWNPAMPAVCYATRGRNGSELLTIDVATGVGTVVADTGFTDGMPGLAINSHGEMFATSRDTGDLYRIDPVTGLTRFIGPTGTASGGFGLHGGIAFDENDVLWGTTSDGGLLETIDTATGATTTIGPISSYDFEHLPGLAFDPDDGTAYGGTFNGNQFHPRRDGILTVDTSNGLTELIGGTGLSETTLPDGMGGTIFLGQRITDLCFVDGELYAAKGGGSQQDNPLVHIDTSVPGGFVLAYANDFEAGGPTVAPGVTAMLTGSTTTAPVPAGFEGLGDLSGNFLHNASGTADPPQTSTVLTLSDLPPHDAIRLNLTFAAINTWDSDSFRIRVDGTTVFNEVFHNTSEAGQTYDPIGNIIQLTPRPFTDLGSPLGGAPAADAVYDLSREILTASNFDPYPLNPSVIYFEHSASTATIEFDVPSAGFTGGADESWAIDGLRVELVSQPTGTVIGLIGFDRVSGMASRMPRCGDGHVDSYRGEACDDGNTVDGDGCPSDCLFSK